MYTKRAAKLFSIVQENNNIKIREIRVATCAKILAN